MDVTDKRTVVVIAANGAVSEVILPSEDMEALHALQDLVGGPIEARPLPERKYLVLNEDAKLDFHFRNEIATELALKAESIQADDYIAGTAVIVDSSVLE